jgi:structural maintenance of chromosome 2
MTNVVVRTRDAVRQLLKHGQLERRVTFIPLDNLSFRPLDMRRWNRAVSLVSKDNVFRAIDLVDFDEEYREAVEYALGSILVCRTPEAASKVCFDRNVQLRVVTLDGDDYRPDGFLTGGSNQKRSNCLMDMDKINEITQMKINLDAQIKSIDGNTDIIQLLTNISQL